MTEPLLRLDQLAWTLDVPRSLLADVPPARPARGRYPAAYSLSASRQYLAERGIAFRYVGAPALE